MTSLKTFTITWNELVSLAFEYLFLIESHPPVCRWLGPYDAREEGEEPCAVARLYQEKFEGRLSTLLISIAAHLRILLDRHSLTGELVGLTENHRPSDSCDSRLYQMGVGKIMENSGDWVALKTLRPLLDTIMHSDRIEFAMSELERIVISEELKVTRAVMGYDDLVVVSAPQHGDEKRRKTIKLSLRGFAHYLFDIVERKQPLALAEATEAQP